MRFSDDEMMFLPIKNSSLYHHNYSKTKQFIKEPQNFYLIFFFPTIKIDKISNNDTE